MPLTLFTSRKFFYVQKILLPRNLFSPTCFSFSLYKFICAFLTLFRPCVKHFIWRVEWVNNIIGRNEVSDFSEQTFKRENTAYIYIYIYIYIYT